jgi:hypothetical protein
MPDEVTKGAAPPTLQRGRVRGLLQASASPAGAPLLENGETAGG